MDKKLGVYICGGCGISDAVDLEKMVKVAGNNVCKTHPFLCGKEGSALITNDMKDEGVNTVVVAACSPRVMYDVFNYGNDVVLERVNIREHVAWSQPNAEVPAPAEGAEAPAEAPAAVFHKATQMMGEDYLRMGIAKAQKMMPAEPLVQDLTKTVMVVGGGVTGMKAALSASSIGYRAILVEKTGALGGWSAKMHKQLPTKAPFAALEAPIAPELAKQVEADANIKVYLNAEVSNTYGAPGMYDVTITSNGAANEEKVGTIVMAVGWTPYDATKLADKYGYGNLANVVTNMQVEEMAKAGSIKRPSDGKAAKNVLFVQCAGSRDADHLPYCSSVCCLASLKQASYVRAQDGDSKAYIIYKDMRTPGLYENYYKAAQNDPGVFLTKGEITSITEAGNGDLVVEIANTLIGENIKIKADMVVLATGMVPNTKPVDVDSKDLPVRTLSMDYADQAAGRKIPMAAPTLNLQYRQGPEVPTLEYGFPDSHYICFPYETQRTGIYAAGAVRSPMGVAQAMNDADGAALKAVQCIELASRGSAVHPRALDMTYPEFRLESCTQCKRCTEECPFSTLDEDEKGTPKPNPTRCRRCGVCMGACPQRIVSFKNYSVDIIGSMIKAVDVPSDDDDQMRFICLMCENDAYPALDMMGINRLQYNNNLRILPVRCLGSVNVVWIADALSRGVDGILMAGCKFGEDYQCHFIKGSEQCNKRMDNVQETLQRLSLEKERVQQIQVSVAEYDKLPAMLDKFVKDLKAMGPNPFKGF
ncbi:MAG: hydrogenase iron-sulfur subunit [Nitrospirae bacterium]|nr:hydrogenase iron-sulfur subunit [Nitrospirota bacterium]